MGTWIIRFFMATLRDSVNRDNEFWNEHHRKLNNIFLNYASYEYSLSFISLTMNSSCRWHPLVWSHWSCFIFLKILSRRSMLAKGVERYANFLTSKVVPFWSYRTWKLVTTKSGELWSYKNSQLHDLVRKSEESVTWVINLVRVATLNHYWRHGMGAT